MMRHITFDPRLTEGAEGNENVLIKFGGMRLWLPFWEGQSLD